MEGRSLFSPEKFKSLDIIAFLPEFKIYEPGLPPLPMQYPYSIFFFFFGGGGIFFFICNPIFMFFFVFFVCFFFAVHCTFYDKHMA